MNELNRAIGELTAEVRGLRRDVQDDRVASANYRQGMRDELGKIVLRQTHLEADVSSIKGKVDDMRSKVAEMEQVTVEVTTLRTKAQGAGTLGRWLIRLGIGIVTVAGWLIGAYTYVTGRPPP